MKASDIINYPLSLLGLKLARTSKWKKLERSALTQENILKDIFADEEFMSVYEPIKSFTLAGIERCYSLYRAVRFIDRNNIPGAFVECGVWKGGSVMLMLGTLLKNGIADRDVYLYDTYEGMTEPGANDGEEEKLEWQSKKNEQGSGWCNVPLEEVKTNVLSTGYPAERIRFVKGRVEQTIPTVIPPGIALLRLDTDWYASTMHELVHLFPLLQKNGILIVDDYGAWTGAKKAVDEYFGHSDQVMMQRIDWTGRLIIK